MCIRGKAVNKPETGELHPAHWSPLDRLVFAQLAAASPSYLGHTTAQWDACCFLSLLLLLLCLDPCSCHPSRSAQPFTDPAVRAKDEPAAESLLCYPSAWSHQILIPMGVREETWSWGKEDLFQAGTCWWNMLRDPAPRWAGQFSCSGGVWSQRLVRK